MSKRLLAAFCVCMLVAAVPAAVAAASSGSRLTDFRFGGRSASEDIWTGLCIGASLNLSRVSQKNCQLKQRPSYSEKTHHGAPAASPIQYAALGDSVAAGAGLAASQNPGDNVCGRSTQAYAYHVAAALGYNFAHFACTGADAFDLLTRQSIRGPNPSAQLNSAFFSGTPQLITITVGGNDVRWEYFLLKCLRTTCGTERDTRIVAASLARLEVTLQDVLQRIVRYSAGAPPTVVFTGYYNPVSAACPAAMPSLSNEEIAWIGNQLADLNQVLQDTAAGSRFATFAPVDFTGHDICSADPWVQGADGPAPLHPTAAGQQAIAQMVLANL